MRFKILEKEAGIQHYVSEKKEDKGCQFSLALHTGEPVGKILKNREALREQFGDRGIFVSVRQVHGDHIYSVVDMQEKGWSSLSGAVEADALVTNMPYVVLTILTADCVPVLLYDPLRHVVAAVHAGWKGSQKCILSQTIACMQSDYDSRPEDIRLAIGPAIGKCCYEVDGEVSRHFLDYAEAVSGGSHTDKYQLDLKRVNQIQAQEAGILPEHMEVSSLCTSCDKGRFFSYRAEQGCSGRFLSAIMLEK